MRKGLIGLALFLVCVALALPAAQTAYYPPAGQWDRKSPAEVAAMDAAKLNEAVEFMIFISPSHDLVVVWRWSAQSNEGFRRVVAAITS